VARNTTRPTQIRPGPPVTMEYSTDSKGRLVRTTLGQETNRYDKYDNGWRDWKWRDNNSGQMWRLMMNGREMLGGVGQSHWNGNGPTIPASMDCRACHAQINVVDKRNVARATDGFKWKAAPPSVAKNGRDGRPGRDGKDGKDGRAGRDGKDADPGEVARIVLNEIKKNPDAFGLGDLKRLVEANARNINAITDRVEVNTEDIAAIPRYDQELADLEQMIASTSGRVESLSGEIDYVKKFKQRLITTAPDGSVTTDEFAIEGDDGSPDPAELYHEKVGRKSDGG
jgi:hypothetical protein